jgi:hypothetical protein
MNHLHLSVFLVVAPCERSRRFGLPLHTQVEEGDR